MLVLLWSLLLFDMEIKGTEVLAVLVLTAGIISLGFVPNEQGSPQLKPVLYALMTALFISGYTVLDGMAVQRISNLHSYVI